MTPDDARRLLTPDALALLGALHEPADDADALTLSTRLHRKGHDPALIAALITQLRLRRRMRERIGPAADRMLLTDDGVQQATRLVVAAAHAGRMRRAGITRVADLGCGLGVDSLAFAAAGLGVLAVDADPVTAALAAWNLAVWPGVVVREGRAEDVDLIAELGPAGLADGAASAEPAATASSGAAAPRRGAVFLDPARRVHERGGTRRTWNPDEFSPALDWAFDVADRWPTGIKLGPGLPHELVPAGLEAEWVSDRGAVVEVALWSGPLAEALGRRSALRHDETGWHRVVAEGADPMVGPVGAHLYEPDGAAIRARALGTLARRHGLHTIDPTIAWLSDAAGAPPVDDPFLRRHRVLRTLPFDRRALRRAVRELAGPLGARRVTVKKRGADLDPAALARDLSRVAVREAGRTGGTGTAARTDRPEPAATAADPAAGMRADELVVIVTRAAGRHVAVLAVRD